MNTYNPFAFYPFSRKLDPLQLKTALIIILTSIACFFDRPHDTMISPVLTPPDHMPFAGNHHRHIVLVPPVHNPGKPG
jgi:hypothetical protein